MGNTGLTDRVAVDVDHVERNAVQLRLDLGGHGTVVRRPEDGSVTVPLTCRRCGTDLVAEVFSLPGTRRLRRQARWLTLVPLAGMVGVGLLFGLVTIDLDTAFPSLLLSVVFAAFVVVLFVLVIETFTRGVYGPWPPGVMSRPRLRRRSHRDHILDVRPG